MALYAFPAVVSVAAHRAEETVLQKGSSDGVRMLGIANHRRSSPFSFVGASDRSLYPGICESSDPNYAQRFKIQLLCDGMVSPRLPLFVRDVGDAERYRKATRRINARDRDDSDRGVPSLLQLAPILLNEAAALEFLLSKGLVDVPDQCCFKEGCDGYLRFKNSRWGDIWKYIPFIFSIGTSLRDSDCWTLRCTKCKGSSSILSGTFFSKTHLSINQVLTLLYSFSRSESVTQASELAGCSMQTASNWFVSTRKLLEAHIVTCPNSQIGGPGRIVQIDETKFGKRKYNRGHRVEGNWVFGGVEYIYDPSNFRFCAGKTFCVVVPRRDTQTLFPIIAQWIRPGTLVWSDAFTPYAHGGEMWRRLGMEHEMVVHEHEFVSVTGVHTNAIEGLWFHLKSHIPNRIYHDAENLQLCLYAEVFIRNHPRDRWSALIGALKLVRYRDRAHPGTRAVVSLVN